MNLVYYQLNSFDEKHHCFPLDFAGLFCDGVSWFPIFQHLQGQILFEFKFNGNMAQADSEFMAATGLNKIPSDVVAYFEQAI